MQNDIDISNIINKLLEEETKIEKAQPHLYPIDYVKEKLLDIFNISIYSLNKVEKDFYIQYSVFEYMGYDPNTPNEYHKDKEQWYMNCILPHTKDEGIYSVEEIQEHDKTEIEFSSWKGNYDTFTLKENINFKGQSTNDRIYVIDLFPDYIPKHFKGEVYTRGGFTGWNWHYL